MVSAVSRSRPRGVIPPLRPSLSSSDFNETKTRERFDSLLPKYGVLWRSMANAKLSTNQQTSIMAVDKENTNPSRRNVGDATFKTVTTGIASSSSSCNYNNKNGTLEGPSLLDAITNKKTISLSVSNQNHNLCGDDCNCEDPILEIDEDDDENNSFYGADDKNINSSSSSSDDDNNPNQSVLFVEDSDDEESILLVSVKKMPRKKLSFHLS